MQLAKRYGLLLTRVTIAYKEHTAVIEDVVVDTGSASTVLAADALQPLGIVPSPHDLLHRVYGVGGSEAVFARTVDLLQVGNQSLPDFVIEVAGMDYSVPINGLLGLGFLEAAEATIDVSASVLEFRPRSS